MRVLVTGSSGLIGRWTCDALVRDGHTVHGLDILPRPDEVDGWDADVCDILDFEKLSEVFERFAPTAVIHLAARIDLEGRTLEDYAVNTDGVRNICKAVENTKSVTRCVYTSSQLVCKVGHVPTQDDEYCPNTVYGESKVKTEQIVRALDGGGVLWCIARPTTVWGPHMNEHYKSLYRHIEAGRYFHAGSGALYKSYSYAGNIAHQYVELLKADDTAIHGKMFYMADYEPLSLREYANRIAKELGAGQPRTYPLMLCRLIALAGDGLTTLSVPFPFTSFRLRNIRTEYIFDMQRTENVCGPLPYTFNTGIEQTVHWYKTLK